MARLAGTNNAGINTVVWNMRAAGGDGRGAGGRGAGAGGGAPGRGGNPLDQWAPLGTYTVTLEVGGKTLVQSGQITHTQGWSLAPSPQIIR